MWKSPTSFIVYEVHVPIADVPDAYDLRRQWYREWDRIDPRPKQTHFTLGLCEEPT
jgi:hypothetical protein